MRRRRSRSDGGIVCHYTSSASFTWLGQAGVRHSLLDPHAYADLNLTGFLNILKAAAALNPKHLIYASSSSVYGANTRMPLRASDNTDHPLSFYGATKKANELMAHAYASLFGLPTTGLRFFTVYGPWGRPDMAMWLFTAAIMDDTPLKLFNNGRLRRDFTDIDDVTEAIVRLIKGKARLSLIPPGRAKCPIRRQAGHHGAFITLAIATRSRCSNSCE